MAGDEIARDTQIKEEARLKGEEEGRIEGIQYWELNRTVYKIINEAAREEELSKKRVILLDSERYTPPLYDIIKSNPDSKELRAQQKGLEDLAERHGLVMTEKGIYLDNKNYI